MVKKFLISTIFCIILSAIGIGFYIHKSLNSYDIKPKNTNIIKNKETLDEKLDKSIILVNSDKNKNGIKDQEDILLGARKEARNKVKYKSAYYVGGYPPDNEGVCTDLIWRAFKNAGYNLKDEVDYDIRNHPDAYKKVEGKPDPNIDFRRVPNLYIYFKRNVKNVTTTLKPNDLDNLKNWQPGDIVTFDNREHIAVVSDKRRADGVPYIIHSVPPYAREDDELMHWMPKITGHFRIVK
ncbi:DUF1287 domain-containing protein [Clostridium fermenticellae]|uniref:DUF1287 domain-containing protein n=1 Tax=Clostridium fermenticellae TaxID=2068654 RepID=A0A386H2N4_9CLOT|nr:DUF1287 domain-containing protein [Clostridium fermenticellae]AYD39971.1 DUF1287 domain-containing protein [Clostridium fermenticellae]